MSKDVSLNIETDDEWKEHGLMPAQDGAENPVESEELTAQLKKDFQ